MYLVICFIIIKIYQFTFCSKMLVKHKKYCKKLVKTQLICLHLIFSTQRKKCYFDLNDFKVRLLTHNHLKKPY